MTNRLDPLYASDSQEWSTPQHVFDALNEEFHFVLDPCAMAINAKCANYYTKEQNGLIQPWAPGPVFMNPPYGKGISSWMCKAIHEMYTNKVLTVCLVHARTDTKWWHECVMPHATEVRFVQGRLRFGGSVNSAPFPSAIILFKHREIIVAPTIKSIRYRR